MQCTIYSVPVMILSKLPAYYIYVTQGGAGKESNIKRNDASNKVIMWIIKLLTNNFKINKILIFPVVFFLFLTDVFNFRGSW